MGLPRPEVPVWKAAYGNEVPRWEGRNLINPLQKTKALAIVYVGIDLAKNAFAAHEGDEAGKPVLVRPVGDR